MYEVYAMYTYTIHGYDTLSFRLLTILYNVYNRACINRWQPLFCNSTSIICNRSMQCAYISCDSDGVYLWSIVFAAMITSERAPAILIRAYDGIFLQIPQSHANVYSLINRTKKTNHFETDSMRSITPSCVYIYMYMK